MGAAWYLLLPFAVQALVSAIDLTLAAGVWLTTAISAGADRPAILMAIGRELFRVFTSARALAIITALALLSAVALFGLQQLLGSDERRVDD